MPFTRHKLEEIKEGNLRARCTRCGQTWTSYHVRSACPGVSVYPYDKLPAYLKTLTALERERKYPPDPEQWDGAYRILNAPYYRLVYDERKAVHVPLTEKQTAAAEKQRATMRARYGCALCDTYYRKEDQQRFKHGICSRCQSAARSWNQLIEWARHIVQEEPVILDIFTNPTERPISFEGRAPDCYYNEAENRDLIEWWKPETYQLAGYQVMNFVTGALERDVPRIIQEDDLFELRHFIRPQSSLLSPAPMVLVISSAVGDMADRAAWMGTSTKRERNPQLETLPLGYHYHARTGRTWTRILEVDSRGHTERQHLEAAATAIGVELQESDETTAAVLRRFVLHLAALETITIAPDEV